MLRTIALSLLLALGCFSGARSEVITGSQRNVQGWTLAAYDVKGRGFNHCGIFVGYRSGITLHFVMFASRVWSIGWSRDSWNFRVGQRVPLQLQVDGAGPYGVTGIAQSRTFVLAELPAGSPLFDMVRRGNEMTIQTPAGGRIGFSLDGTSLGLGELAACVDRFTGVAAVQQPAVPQLAPARSASVPASTPRSPAMAPSDAQDELSMRLHRAACSSTVRKVTENREQFWVCDRPRDYPTRAAAGGCRLNFPGSVRGKPGIYYGKFTAPRLQVIAMYTAACEPHANNWGGSALFDVTGDDFRLVRYFVGHRFFDCAMPPAPEGEVQTPYCLSSFTGQGQLSEGFGPVRFGADGQVKSEDWFSAGNIDGARGSVVSCPGDTPTPHHLRSVRWDESTSRIVVEAAVRDPAAVARACERHKQSGPGGTADLVPILPADEGKYLKLLVRFRPGNKTPEVELTSEQVSYK